jgi:hypothetical protein
LASSTTNREPTPSSVWADRPSHRLEHPLAQRQAKTGSLRRAVLRAQPLERLEHLLEHRRGDPGSVIGDGDLHTVPLRAAADGDLTAIRVVLHCIGEEIEQHLLESLNVGFHPSGLIGDRGLDGDVARLRYRRHEIHHLTRESAYVHGLG